jgi:steroid delta-isomerase-like uncharacterized protein
MGSLHDIFKEGERAFNAHDIDAEMALYSQDAQFSGPGGMELKGIDAIRQFTQSWFQGFPDATVRTDNLIEAGDTLVQEGVFTGTHTGVFPTPMGDIPPTGKRVEGKFIDVYVIRDGKIVRDHLVFDRMELMEQLGLMPAAAGAAAG